MILPSKKLEININQVQKEREVAEVLESDEFKALEQLANKIRDKIENVTESPVEAETTSDRLDTQVEVIPPPQSKGKVLTRLNAEFLEHCRQELCRCIGPIGNLVLEETLAQSPDLTPGQLVEALAAEIPDLQRVQEFKNHIEIPAELLIEMIGSQWIPLKGEFLEHCRQELCRCIGPIGNLVLEETLAQSPDLTPGQLVEALAAEIPDLQRVQEFKSRIKLPSKL